MMSAHDDAADALFIHLSALCLFGRIGGAVLSAAYRRGGTKLPAVSLAASYNSQLSRRVQMLPALNFYQDAQFTPSADAASGE